MLALQLVLFALSCDAPAHDSSHTSRDEPAPLHTQQHIPALVAADHRQFRAAAPGRYTAHIRGLLIAELTDSGLAATAHGDTIGLSTVSYGSHSVGGSEPAEGACALGAETIGEACVRQVELAHGLLTEWWTSRAEGLEHGWTLHEAPEAGSARLELEITEGALRSVDEDGLGAWLEGSTGQLWRYDGLIAWDADGASVVAWMEARGDRLVIALEAEGVRWPVTVDPTLTLSESKISASDGTFLDIFGAVVSGAGDVDGDGYDDVVVGVPGDSDSGAYSGSAYVYYGSSAGIDLSSEDKLTASDGAASDYFGSAVSGAGDVDGDGYDDIVIGAYWDDDNGTSSGSAYVYYGSSAGIDASSEDKVIASDGAVNDYFGLKVSGAGDVDGDGYDDIIIGAIYGDDSGLYRGAVYAYYGSSAGIDLSSEDKITASDAASGDYFSSSIAGAGDVNGDGYDDVIIGAYGDDDSGSSSGSVYVYRGSSAGIDLSTEDKLTAFDAATSDYFGGAVAGAGDVNGDGYDDVVIGAYGDDDSGSSSGSAYVYYGSSAGIDASSADKIIPLDGSSNDDFGTVVAGAGDVNGDGYDDIVIGMPEDDDSGSGSGSAYVCFGTSSGIDLSTENKLTASDGAAGDDFGCAVSGAGDVNGDGYDDVIIGASGDDDNGAASGSAYIYSGTCHDQDEDGYCLSDGDCDDTDASIHPGAAEVIDDGIDQDCDGTETCYADADEDGYIGGSTTTSTDADCTDAGEGQATDPEGDCDDTDAAFNPGADEDDCTDPSDYNCDGEVTYVDADADGWAACEECDDTDDTVRPDADEVCDGIDNDCDGEVDNDAVDAGIYYADADGDSYGDAASPSVACQQPDDATDDATDCDDADPASYPGAAEIEDDGIDQDCDGADAVSTDADVSKEGCGGCATRSAPASGGAGMIAGLLVLAGLRRRTPQNRTPSDSSPSTLIGVNWRRSSSSRVASSTPSSTASVETV